MKGAGQFPPADLRLGTGVQKHVIDADMHHKQEGGPATTTYITFGRRSAELLQMDELAGGGNPVTVEEEQHVVTRRGLPLLGRSADLEPGRRGRKVEGVRPLAGIEGVRDRADVNPPDLG